MDQEGSGRRRSTRLAARGLTFPKVETPAKKIVKSSEKPKRTKRKTAEEEEVIDDVPEFKKAKSEEAVSSDETDRSTENKANSIESNDEPEVTPIIVDKKEKPAVEDDDDEEEEDVPATDPIKEVENPTADDKKEVYEVEEQEEEEQEEEEQEEEEQEEEEQEEEEEPKVQEQEVVVEQAKIDVSPEKSVPVPVAAESINGNSGNVNAVEPVKGIAKSDNGFCVAAKDTITPNGDTDLQMNSANGDKVDVKPENLEPIKVLHDNTNHVAENDLKAVTSPVTVHTTSNNDLSGVEQDEKEQDKVVDNAVDVTVSSTDNAPSVEQPPSVVS